MSLKNGLEGLSCTILLGLSSAFLRYEAIRTWNRLLKSADSEYWVQLAPGTAVVVDNHRVLHGRSSFDGKRRMCGAYIGLDEYRSKLAILKERFDPDRVTIETRDPASGRSVGSCFMIARCGSWDTTTKTFNPGYI